MEVDFKLHKKFIISSTVVTLLLVLTMSLGIPIGYFMLGRITIEITVPTFAYMQFYMVLFGLQFSYACFFISERSKLLNDHLR